MKKLKLKDSIYILKESDDIYQVIFTATRKIKKFGVDFLVKEIINEIKEGKTEEELFSNLGGKYNWKKINNCLMALEHEGIARRYDETQIEKRYSRQISFIDELSDSWEETLSLQKKIRNSTVSVFGVGGIGTWIVNGLYQLGVGEIRISDPDVVEESNLNRQLFFDSRDIGKYKVDAIKDRLPDARILHFKKMVSKEEDLERIVSGSDFLVNCADSPSVEETSRIINEYAVRENISYCVAGGYNLHLGMVGPIIVPGKSKTFNEFLQFQRASDSLSSLEKVKDIEQTGNLGPIAGAIANIQIMEIFKYLIGKGNLNINRFAEIDFMDFNVMWREF
ncbi:SAMP-activating enzyme E1 [uncultured archaeon]|nr:SAMP-activating enzyme E1 [uncultured archaeon]